MASSPEISREACVCRFFIDAELAGENGKEISGDELPAAGLPIGDGRDQRTSRVGPQSLIAFFELRS